eukprot:3741020-Prymnesium_polylepis.1
MADAPNYGFDVYGFKNQLEEDSNERLSSLNFVYGQCFNLEGQEFEQRVNGLIEEGWKFDWVLGSVFGILMPGGVFMTISFDSEEVNRQMTCAKDRVEMLIAAGAEPVITARELMNYWPNAREIIAYEQHSKYRFLKLKVDLLLDHTIYVNFDEENEVESCSVFLTILRCILQVAPQVEMWNRHAYSLDEKFIELHRNDEDKTQSNQYVYDASVRNELFKSYENELTRGLCRLIVHLASPQGSNVHEKARHNMRSLFVHGIFDTLQVGSAMRDGALKLYNCLRNDGGFETWPLYPN